MDLETLIEQHKYLVPLTRKRVVPRIPERVEAEDLDGAGYLGLVEGARRFDPDRSVQIKTWLITWIRGAILEHLRQTDWLSRGARDRVKRGEIEPVELVSLEEWMANNPEADLAGVGVSAEETALKNIQAQMVRRLVGCLPLSERRLIRARFWGEVPLETVGARLGLSESRVEQMQKAALVRLRCFLERTGAVA